MMKNLIIICVLLPLLFANTSYPQDTLALEPAVRLEVTNIMPIENNLMITTGVGWSSQWLSIYDISNPSEPELIDHAFALRMAPRGGEHHNEEKITGAILFDDIVVWVTMHQIGHPIKDDVRYGPIELWGRRIGDDEALWQRELYREEYQRIEWPGNMVRYEDYLFLAGGESGVLIYDMSDPADPELVNVLEYENYRIIIIEERLLIYYRELFGNRVFFRLFDLSNPEEPEHLGTFDLFTEPCPYGYAVENVTYNGYLLLRNQSNADSSSILVLDVTSDDAPSEVAIIDLGRDLDIYYFCISDDRLFITPFRRSYVDIYNINDNYEIEHLATVSPERTPDGQFLVHDNKLIFSYFYRGCPTEASTTYIYENPPVSVSSPPNPPPSTFSLSTYPNPFNSRAILRFSVNRPDEAWIGVYDIQGRELLSDYVSYPAGKASYILTGRSLGGAGVYIVRIGLNGREETLKVVYLP